jgi:hypothetical protein
MMDWELSLLLARFVVPVVARGKVNSAEAYRRFAAECVLLANRSHDPDSKAALLEMATAWQTLAQFVENRVNATFKVPDGGDQT